MNQVFKITHGLAILASAAALVASPKSVNVELETSLLFEPKDSHQHIKFLRSVRNVLDRLERALRPQNLGTHDTRKGILTAFVHDLVKTLSKLHEVDLQLFFTNLEKEMRGHFYRGSVFREIVYDPKLQTHVRNKLIEWTHADPRMMKAKLRMYLNDMNKNTTLNRLWAFLSDYFDANDEIKLKGIIDDLRDANSFQDVIKEALDFLVFGKYDKMNYNSRAKFANEMNKLSDAIDSKSIDKDLMLTFRKHSDDGESKEPIDFAKVKSKEIRKDPKEQAVILNKDVDISVKAFDARENRKDEDDLIEQRSNISSDNNVFLNKLMNDV